MKSLVLLSMFASITLLGMDTSTRQQLNTIIAHGLRKDFDQNIEVFRTTLSYLDLQDAYNDCQRQLNLLKTEVSHEQLNLARDNILYMSHVLKDILCTEFEFGPLQYNKQGGYGFRMIYKKKR